MTSREEKKKHFQTIIKFFKEGMRLKPLATYYSMNIKPITVPGLRYLLIKNLGEEQYKIIKKSFVKNAKN